MIAVCSPGFLNRRSIESRTGSGFRKTIACRASSYIRREFGCQSPALNSATSVGAGLAGEIHCHHRPPKINNQSAVGDVTPTYDSRLPNTDHRPPPINHQPSTNNQRPTTNNQPTYLPLNSGARFSMNARMASAKSSDCISMPFSVAASRLPSATPP